MASPSLPSHWLHDPPNPKQSRYRGLARDAPVLSQRTLGQAHPLSTRRQHLSALGTEGRAGRFCPTSLPPSEARLRQARLRLPCPLALLDTAGYGVLIPNGVVFSSVFFFALCCALHLGKTAASRSLAGIVDSCCL